MLHLHVSLDSNFNFICTVIGPFSLRPTNHLVRKHHSLTWNPCFGRNTAGNVPTSCKKYQFFDQTNSRHVSRSCRKHADLLPQKTEKFSQGLLRNIESCHTYKGWNTVSNSVSLVTCSSTSILSSSTSLRSSLLELHFDNKLTTGDCVCLALTDLSSPLFPQASHWRLRNA